MKFDDKRFNRLKIGCKKKINNFKRDIGIKEIIESVGLNYGIIYLDNILKYQDINIDWDDIKKLNDIGNPENNSFTINGKNYELSPTTLRYVQFSLDILKHMKNKNIKEVDIVEIGGGYGGQACLLYLLADTVKINSYTILDLPEVNILQNKFNHHYKIK